MRKLFLWSLACLFLLTFTDRGNCTDKVTLKNYLKTEQDCINFSQKAGDLIHKGKISEAYDILHSPDHFLRFDIPYDHKKVITTNLKSLQYNLTVEFGKRIEDGFEYIGTLKTGSSIISVYFFSKHDFMPIAWKMVFYKPENDWKFMEFFTGPELHTELLLFSEQVKL